MTTNHPGRSAHGQELSVAYALRECLVSGVVVIDEQIKEARLTVEAERMLGLSPREEGRTPLAGLPPALLEAARDIHSREGHPTSREMELNLPRSGRRTFRVNAVACGGPQAVIVLVLNDLTSAAQFEQHVQQLDWLTNLGTLAASMAHEIKNALVAVKTFTDLLLEQHQDAELAKVVRNEMSRIEGIVSRMLRFSGPSRATRAKVQVHNILDHALLLMEPRLTGKAIKIERNFAAAPDNVLADKYELQQAFLNLLLNAVEAMGDTGTLRVATGRSVSEATARGAAAQHVLIELTDTGPGIPSEVLPHIFEPFFTTKTDGTGLGLAVTRRIIHDHRGTITVENPGGAGTTFRIHLPAGK
jgi:two-component system nitrogen regulation sensor histidine kinase GlnL